MDRFAKAGAAARAIMALMRQHFPAAGPVAVLAVSVGTALRVPKARVLSARAAAFPAARLRLVSVMAAAMEVAAPLLRAFLIQGSLVYLAARAEPQAVLLDLDNERCFPHGGPCTAEALGALIRGFRDGTAPSAPLAPPSEEQEEEAEKKEEPAAAAEDDKCVGGVCKR